MIQGAKLLIEIRHGIGDNPTQVTVTDLTVAENQFASCYVLRGGAYVTLSVGRDGVGEIGFTPNAARDNHA